MDVIDGIPETGMDRIVRIYLGELGLKVHSFLLNKDRSNESINRVSVY